MSHNTDISKLDDLITTTIDSVRGYEHSADHADAGRYVDFFHAMAHERSDVIDALAAQSRALGGTPAEYGSAAGTIHRRVEDLRIALGGGDEAILSEIERGEDYLKEEFERALTDANISASTQTVMRQCYESVLRGHDRVRQLRDQFAAAH